MRAPCAALVLIFVAGCVAPGQDMGEEISTSTLPISASGGNLTGCSGAVVYLSVPTILLETHIPAGFAVLETVPGIGTLAVDALTCKKVAVGGVDAGAAHILLVSITVNSDEPTAATYVAVVVEAITSSESLAEMFGPDRIKFADLEIEVSGEQLVPDALRAGMSGSSRYPGVAYDWQAPLFQGASPETENIRYFSANTPTAFWDSERHYVSTGSSATSFMASAGSTIADIAVVPVQPTGLSSWVPTLQDQWRVPADDAQ